MAKKTTQEDRILAYINEFGSISAREAYLDLGVMRLAARISDLTERGYIFERTMETAKNRYGEETRFARYTLARRPHEHTTVTRAEAIQNFEEWKERIDT